MIEYCHSMWPLKEVIEKIKWPYGEGTTVKQKVTRAAANLCDCRNNVNLDKKQRAYI